MYIDDYGLTNSRPDEKNAENALTWTAEHILLEDALNKPSEARIATFKTALNKCRVRPGVFHQNPSYALSEPVVAHDKYMSRDQLISICGISKKYGWGVEKEIWKEIKRQWFRYDNVNPDKPRRWITPWDLAFYALCADSWIGRLLYPFLAMSCFWSCLRKKEDASGKLLTFIRCKSLKLDSLFGKCTKLLFWNNKYWWSAFNIYFRRQLNHPCIQLARELNI